ncbi:MAG: GNAT family N-acetyltransferase [Anaerolineae bacterium]|nr:GNAT family N-acetyltransferase [Anaerolineae bacterium]
MDIIYKADCEGVDWAQLKERNRLDDFDNGRSVLQYETSFRASAHVIFAYGDAGIIGCARALSDGICNGYIVDVWTHTPWRQQGIATEMVKRLCAAMPGQHICLFTNDAVPFYTRLGFTVETTGMSKVQGQWLVNETDGG